MLWRARASSALRNELVVLDVAPMGMRNACAVFLLASFATFSCARYPRTQTVLQIHTTETIARMTQSLSVVVRDNASAEVLNIPISTQRNFLERTVDFPGYPVRIPISSANRSETQQGFGVCVRGTGFAGAETASQCVQSGFALGKVLTLDVWLLPAGSCSACPTGTGCVPMGSTFACVSTLPGDLPEYGVVPDASMSFDAATVDSAAADSRTLDSSAVDSRAFDSGTGS